MRARLKEKGLSQVALSKKLGLSESAASQWIGGKCNPTKENLEKIAQILECSTEELSGGGCWNEY